VDISRDGTHVALGTGIVSFAPLYNVGDVYLFDNAAPATPSVLAWNKWIYSVRFSADGQFVAVGSPDNTDPPAPSYGVLSTPTLTPVCLGPNSYDSVYSVALSAAGDRLGTGLGSTNRVYYWDTQDCVNWLWRSLNNLGTTESMSHADSDHFMVSASRRDGLIGSQAFVLWDTTAPDPMMWRFNPSVGSTSPTWIDLAVQTPGQFIAGCWTTHLYLWAASAGPAPGSPLTDWTLASNCLGNAMTYEGAYSALVDSTGHVYAWISNTTVTNRPPAWIYALP